MAKELAKTYTASDGQELTLTPGVIARYILGNVDNVPEAEYAKVIMTCASRGLNPLAGDVAVQPRWDKKKGCNILSVVPTKDYFQRRAEAHPSYQGKEYGIVVFNEKEGRLLHKEGTGLYPELGEKLLGGWCKVHVKGHDMPEYAEVSMAEYDQGFALWQSKPATMIAKVAKSQALREAFPNEFQGLYEPEEIGLETDADGEPIAEAVTIGGEETVRVPVFGPDGWNEMDDGQRAEFTAEVASRDIWEDF